MGWRKKQPRTSSHHAYPAPSASPQNFQTLWVPVPAGLCQPSGPEAEQSQGYPRLCPIHRALHSVREFGAPAVGPGKKTDSPTATQKFTGRSGPPANDTARFPAHGEAPGQVQWARTECGRASPMGSIGKGTAWARGGLRKFGQAGRWARLVEPELSWKAMTQSVRAPPDSALLTGCLQA